jgi:hypothetical protein
MKKIAIVILCLAFYPTFTNASQSALQITTTQLRDATIGKQYSTKLKVMGGVAPYQWTTLSTTYPVGCCILGLANNADPLDSHFVDFTTQSSSVVDSSYSAGNYDWTVKVQDAVGNTVTQTITLNIKPAVK